MAYYAVESGNLFRCVEADSAVMACLNAVEAHLCDNGCTAGDLSPGMLFHVSKLGDSMDNDTYLLADHVKAHAVARGLIEDE